MKKQNKKINNGFIVMSKGERAGVISLLSVITILLAFSIFRPVIRFSKQDEAARHNLDSMIALQEKKVNKAEGGPAEMDKNTTPKTRAKENKPERSQTTETSPAKEIPILDINTADSLALVALPQIGEVMASRIHRYRDRLGGFVTLDQLFEVKGMDSTRFDIIKPYIILDNKEIRKLEINRDEFKTLLRHPYLEYDQVKAIVNHRERKGLIKNWEQLQGIVGEVNPILENYVGF
jgi:DNA uptake protein ComE-like DNA-binding protein